MPVKMNYKFSSPVRSSTSLDAIMTWCCWFHLMNCYVVSILAEVRLSLLSSATMVGGRSKSDVANINISLPFMNVFVPE